MRPGYYVDALLNIETEEDVEGMIKKLQEGKVPTRKTSLMGRAYLAVAEVNTKEVADNIRRLKH